MKTPYPKPKLTLLTDPDEIESARRGRTDAATIHDINATEVNGKLYGYTFSVERYRKRRLRAEPGPNHLGDLL